MYELVPHGKDSVTAQPGDFILCHRRGFASAVIRAGEAIRYRQGDHWSHAAFVEDEDTLIEALTRGVVRTPLSYYRDTEYVLVKTAMSDVDTKQALAFVRSCVGDRYGFSVDAGIAMRFLTPGRGLWFGMNGTEICSGLVAQALVRGWANFTVNAAAISPSELAAYYNAPRRASDVDRGKLLAT